MVTVGPGDRLERTLLEKVKEIKEFFAGVRRQKVILSFAFLNSKSFALSELRMNLRKRWSAEIPLNFTINILKMGIKSSTKLQMVLTYADLIYMIVFIVVKEF